MLASQQTAIPEEKLAMIPTPRLPTVDHATVPQEELTKKQAESDAHEYNACSKCACFAINSRLEQIFCHVHGKRPHADQLGSEADAVEFEHVGFDEVGNA